MGASRDKRKNVCVWTSEKLGLDELQLISPFFDLLLAFPYSLTTLARLFAPQELGLGLLFYFWSHTKLNFIQNI